MDTAAPSAVFMAPDDAVDVAVDQLRETQPLFAAVPTFTARQLLTVLLVTVALLLSASLALRATAILIMSIAQLFYLFNTFDRMILIVRGLRAGARISITDAEARAIPEDELPVYTVLLPAFHEPEIVRELVAGVGQLEYPPDKLDIKLLLEADDELTVNAARHATGVDVILVPPREPRTKPKACNVGLQFARGSLLTIYDAEDVPEPLQLRRAVAAFAAVDDDVVCLQGKLGYFNERQNLLTLWFSTEYDQWFGYMLPAFAASGAPLPLGGTSNHIRTDVLVELGGWDPANVTEDADLGIRLARRGYRTCVLDSHTSEEANSDPVNWVRQRSRWYKGYLQTFLVHSRQPLRTARELGPAGFLRFVTFTLGTPASAVVNLGMWLLALLWLLGARTPIAALFPTPTYFVALISLVLGNGAVIYLGILTTCEMRKPHLLLANALVPLYWLLMSLAALKAFLQLITNPTYWEKTVHGLAGEQESDGS